MSREEIIDRLMESASSTCPMCGGNRPLMWVRPWNAYHRVCENVRWQQIDDKTAFPLYHSCAPMPKDHKTLFDYTKKP